MSHLGGNDQPGSVKAAESTIENTGPRRDGIGQCDQMEQLTIHIPKVVAQSTGKEVTELPPLYDVIDGDALNTLIKAGSQVNHVQVTFEWADCTVTVTSAETIEVTVEPHS